MSTPQRDAVVILGATSSVARAIAHEFAHEGHPIILAARDIDEARVIAVDIEVRFGVPTEVVRFDADRIDQTDRAFDRFIELAGQGLAGVVLCYGYMGHQAEVQTDPEATRRTIDVNFTSAALVLEQCAAYFAEKRRGFIAVLSSVAGDRGRQSNYSYGAAKAGLTTYVQGLRNRMHRFGVQVTTIKPGFMDSKMTFGVPGLFLVASPEEAGRAIHRAIRKKKDVAYVPWFWRYIMLIIRQIPEPIFKRLKL